MQTRLSTWLRRTRSEHWQSGEENRERGIAWLDQIYKHNRASTIKLFDAHKDFGKHYTDGNSPVMMFSCLDWHGNL